MHRIAWLLPYVTLSVANTAVSFFVYGEKIDIYSGVDDIQREFMEAGMDYMQSFDTLKNAMPIYKLYPTKTYREYKKTVMKMQKAG